MPLKAKYPSKILAAVADDAARFDVEADVSNREPRLIAEARNETQETPYIRKI